MKFLFLSFMRFFGLYNRSIKVGDVLYFDGDCHVIVSIADGFVGVIWGDALTNPGCCCSTFFMHLEISRLARFSIIADPTRIVKEHVWHGVVQTYNFSRELDPNCIFYKLIHNAYHSTDFFTEEEKMLYALERL